MIRPPMQFPTDSSWPRQVSVSFHRAMFSRAYDSNYSLPACHVDQHNEENQLQTKK